jgi:divalent anion:Na+ symporter, DASS family
VSTDRSSAASTTPPPRAAERAGANPGRLALVLGVGLVIWWLPRPAGIEPRAWQLLAIFVATILGIMVKPLPMWATAALGSTVALLTGTLTVWAALSGFSNGTLWLVFAAFLMSAGFIKTGLGERIAYRLVSLFGGSTLGLSYSLAATDLALAPAVASNTARAGGVMFPIVRSICATAIEENAERGRRTSAFLMLTAYHANVITSAMFLTASGANPIAADLAAETQGIRITWAQWFYAGVVPGLVSLALVPMLISRLLPPGAMQTPEAPRLAAAALRTLGPMKREERLLAVISIAMVAAWILAGPLDLDKVVPAWTTVAALTGLSLLLVVGVLTWGDILRNQEAWNTFVWFGTLLMMASQLNQLGLIAWFSQRVGSMFVGVHWMTGFLGLGLIYFYSHYFFASSAAHVSAMFAAFLGVAVTLGTPPHLAALVLGFYGSLFAGLTHYGGAAAPILFGSGYVALRAWWRVGFIISVVEIVIWLGLGGLWWRLIGIWEP